MSANFFGPIDYLLIALYAIALVAMGLYFKRKASGSLDEYLVGGRSVPWWILGMAGMTNCLDLSGSALIISFLFMMGPRGLFIEFRGGVVLVLICMMVWTGKWHRRSGCLTGAEWNIFRFGDNRWGQATELISVAANVLLNIGMLGMLMVGAGSFLAMYIPLPPLIAVLALVGLATVYVMVSGFYGVVYTDLFQAGIILVMTLVISVIAFIQVPDYAGICELARKVTGGDGWGSAAIQWETHMPRGYEAYRPLMLLAAFYLLRNLVGSFGSGADPRYFGARNDRECGLLTGWWMCLLTFRWPMMMGMAVLGLVVIDQQFPDAAVTARAAKIVHEHCPNSTREQWTTLLTDIAYNGQKNNPAMDRELRSALGEKDFASRMQLVSFDGTVNPERILPSVLQFSLRPGLRGLVVVALLAGALATFGGSVNATAGFLVRNVYQRYLRRDANNRELVLAGWGSTLLVVIGGYAFAYSARSINDLWGWITMGLSTGLIVPAVLRLYWWRFNGGGFVWGTATGVLAAVAQRLCLKEMSEIKIFLLTFTVGLIGSVAGAYLTPPTDETVLRNFYLRTRPFGVWGRFKRLLPVHEREIISREHRNDLLSAPFALLFQVTMFMTPTLVIIKHWTAAMIYFGLWLIGAGGLYWFWYRSLPAENWYAEPDAPVGKDSSADVVTCDVI